MTDAEKVVKALRSREWPTFTSDEFIVAVDECDGLFVFAVLDRATRCFLPPQCTRFKVAVERVRPHIARLRVSR